MPDISAIIVVKENPPHLFKTLQSIDDFVSEIIIGNINIPDGLKREISKNTKVKIFDVPETTPFADLVKEDLKKNAGGRWILYLDPDEIFPQDAKNVIAANLRKYDYFLFPRKNIMFGRWIQHSRWWPDYQLRLFKKNSVVWPKTLHPAAKGRGNGFSFEEKEKFAILHYNYDSIDQYLEKAARYARFEATSYVKQKKEYSLADAFKRSTSEFVGRFFAHDGYKDGGHGLVLAVLQMFYYLLVYFYFWEQKKYAPLEKEEIVKNSRGFFRQLLYETNFWIARKKITSLFGRIKIKLENALLAIFR